MGSLILSLTLDALYNQKESVAFWQFAIVGGCVNFNAGIFLHYIGYILKEDQPLKPLLNLFFYHLIALNTLINANA